METVKFNFLLKKLTSLSMYKYNINLFSKFLVNLNLSRILKSLRKCLTVIYPLLAVRAEVCT